MTNLLQSKKELRAINCTCFCILYDVTKFIHQIENFNIKVSHSQECIDIQYHVLTYNFPFVTDIVTSY